MPVLVLMKKSPGQQCVKAQTAESTPRRSYSINPRGSPRIGTLCKFPGAAAAASGTSLRTKLFCSKILILILIVFPVFGQQLLNAPRVHGGVQQGVG